MDFGGGGRSNVGQRLAGGRKEGAMADPWAVLAGLGAVAFVFVLAPVAGSVYLHLRAPRWLRCPETHMPAAVAVDAWHATWTAAFNRPLLRIRACTLWPEKAGCAQRCCELPEVSAAPRPERLR
jgi:hypothetical protein